MAYRKVKDIATDGLVVKASGFCSSQTSAMPLQMLTALYDTELRNIMDSLAPVKI